MHIHQLVHVGAEVRLRHPDAGEVLWTNKVWKATSGAWGLVRDTGRERGRALIADESALLDGRWEAVSEGSTETTNSQLTENTSTADHLGDPAAVTTREQFEQFVTAFRSNALDDPRLWSASAGELIRHLQRAVCTMPSYAASDRSEIDPNVPSWPLFAWLLKTARSLLDM